MFRNAVFLGKHQDNKTLNVKDMSDCFVVGQVKVPRRERNEKDQVGKTRQELGTH